MALGRDALHLNQRQTAELLGASLRTVQRWDAGQSEPGAHDMAGLAIAVHPNDPALAARIAPRSGKTLEQLGLPPEKTESSDDGSDAAKRVAPELVGHFASSVVCATADVLAVPPATARAALLVAFRTAADLGLTVEDLVSALAVAPSKGGIGRSKSSRRAR
jgi:transcriptional regulator with XRE-family HTH domain